MLKEIIENYDNENKISNLNDNIDLFQSFG